MTPLFFGSSAAPLYGVYHAPSSSTSQQQAVLLCAPFGQEYMRSHRAFRQLAMLLNKQGYGVLRFDYKGTGDSYGEPEDASVEDWLENIVQAAEELKHSSQVDRISLVGLRLGGLLASAASTQINNVDQLVLWDSVNSGQDYFNELCQAMDNNQGHASRNLSASGDIHFNGFVLTKPQLDALKELELAKLQPSANKIFQICSSQCEQQEQLKLAWSQYMNFHYQHVPAPGDWNFVDDFGGILLPQQIIQAIVASFNNH